MIDALLNVSEVEADVFEGQPRLGTILPKAFGGHTMGQALAAACRTVDDSRSPVSAQGFFLSAGDTDGPTRFTVERVRDGRSMDMRAVRAHQGHREIFRLTASFQTEEYGFAHEAPMPLAAPPEEVPPLVDVMDRHSSLDSGPWRTEWSFLDLRYVEENLIDPAPDRGRQQLWMRLPQAGNGEPWRGRCLVTYVSDLALLAASLVPHGVMLGAPDIPRATLTHSVHFHADPTPGEWVFIDQRSEWAGGGRGLSHAAMYSRDGQRLATFVQDGLIRQRRPR
ncbi:MAG: acyl-CoA thioesterase [Brevibacterium yomogidense]|uniref:acyl-CoA thioesterase n=1 Tax=Brevibacterium sp. Mu109 TaxID=1255669 RepID=UPI000C5E6F82|nr:acyl-CoA thioesterase domain-containing protein [Brevibacterium sp. Mu109]SMX91344.1 acyl-CoA thioesterase-2 [Brevibacterium sp. Mu109]